MSPTVINLARDFSATPGGRFRTDGPYTGERFREDLLWPTLRKSEQVVVQLDGVEGFGSSFLEEAFGGLVREGYLSAETVKKKLTIETTDPAWSMEIWEYIEAARPQS